MRQVVGNAVGKPGVCIFRASPLCTEVLQLLCTLADHSHQLPATHTNVLEDSLQMMPSICYVNFMQLAIPTVGRQHTTLGNAAVLHAL